MSVRATSSRLRSGDALLAFDADLTIVVWNEAAEALTGVSRDDAVGRRCWEVLGGHDERGNVVCHPGCAIARLAREAWPVRSQRLLVKAPDGKRRVDLSTLLTGPAGVLRSRPETLAGRPERPSRAYDWAHPHDVRERRRLPKVG